MFSRTRITDSVSQRGELHGTADHVVDNQNDDRSNHRDQNAVKIQTCDAGLSELAEEPTSDHSADYSQEDVQDQSFSRLVYELASDEPSN